MRALGAALLLSACAASGSGTQQQCSDLMQRDLPIPYSQWNSQAKVDEVYRDAGPTFIVFVTAVDHVPLTGVSHEQFTTRVWRDGMHMLPISGLPEMRCPVEVSGIVGRARQWNDRMYSRVRAEAAAH